MHATGTGPHSVGPRRFVAVAGNMGAGKSTLVEFLSRTYGIQPSTTSTET